MKCIRILVAGIGMLSLAACGGSSAGEGSKSLLDDLTGDSADDSHQEDDGLSDEEFNRILRELDDLEDDFKADLERLDPTLDFGDDADFDEDASTASLPQPASSSSDPDEPTSETNWQKTKKLYNAAKEKVKSKKDEWVDDHRDQIDDAKEKGRGLKSKAKAKIGRWLDRALEKLED